MLPDLSAEDIERYVALGERGKALQREGDLVNAERMYRAQTGVFPGNYQPHLSLATLAAQRGEKKAAVEHLEQAVLRGFRELLRLERSEAWTKIGRPIGYLDLVDAVPAMQEQERNWPAWDAFVNTTAPDDLQQVLQQHAVAVARIEELSPALGPHLTDQWTRLLERASASRLETYVQSCGDADDIGPAVEYLVLLYADGPLGRWEALPRGATAHLERASKLLLDRFPESERRPEALMARALVLNMRRFDGALKPETLKRLQESLEEIVSTHGDSTVAAAAMVGLIRTDLESGGMQAASARYGALASAHADSATWADVRDGLGQLALQVGGLPEFRVTDLEGKTIDLEALRGKVTVIDFWATWCQPCVKEFPTLQKIDRKHGEDVVVLGVNLDWPDDVAPDDLREWIAQRELPGSHVQDGLSWDSDLVRDFGVKEIPFNVVVGPDGKVIAVNSHGKGLEKTVRAALNRPD
ncbi:MAG: redoxin domain-containing protein [bacterium]|nr:redoxin domain-containing protein [bacterium]